MKHVDDLKKYQDHDGIVIDDVGFTHIMNIGMHIHLCSVEEARPIHCRHSNAEIGACPMIITCNPQRFPPVALDDDAVKRRCHVVEFLGPNKLFCIKRWDTLPHEVMEMIWQKCWGAVFMFHKNHKAQYPLHYKPRPVQGSYLQLRWFRYCRCLPPYDYENGWV